MELSSGRNVVLLLASEMSAPDEERFPLDRIRMQKAVFLICMRGPEKWGDAYHYRPYDWGPYSDQLTADIGELTLEGLLRFVQGNGRYKAHATTAAGDDLAAKQWGLLSSSEQKFIRNVREYVTNKSFRDLLIEVYAAYPEYASKSRFAG